MKKRILPVLLFALALATSAIASGPSGAGWFISTSGTCSENTSPVTGQSLCWDAVDHVWKWYNGTTWPSLPTLPIVTPPLTPADASSITFDWSKSSELDLIGSNALSVNTMFTFTNMTAGQKVLLEIQQAASGGPYTVGITNTVKWQNASTWTMTTTASKKDYVWCHYDGTDLTCSPNQTY